CCRGVMGAIVLEFDDLTALDRWIPEMAALLRKSGVSSPSSVDLGAAEALIRALLLRDAGNAELDSWIDYGEQHARLQPHSDAAAELALGRAMAAVLRAEFASAESIISGLRSPPAQHSPAINVACHIAAALGRLFDGSHAGAMQAAESGLATAT